MSRRCIGQVEDSGIGQPSNLPLDVAVQPDRRIVVAGEAFGGSYDFAAVRYGRDLVLQKTAAVTTAELMQPITYTLRFANTAVITTAVWESNLSNNARSVGVWVTGHAVYLPLVLKN